MDLLSAGFFLVSAIALLGSPGPAIAALISIGRTEGLKIGMRYNIGLQFGLAITAGMSALGLYSIFETMPSVTRIMSAVAVGYLIYLSYKIATAPINSKSIGSNTPSSMSAGIFLGLTNPKAYVAFVSLYASYSIYPSVVEIDIFVKWLFCVLVMIVVDTIWLLIGVRLGQVKLSPVVERFMNICFAAMIIGATALALK